MIRKSDAVSIFRATRGSRSIEISVPGSFTAVGFLAQRKNPELLPLTAADLLCSRPLTKTEEKDTITSTAQADPLIPKEFLS
jgi:hypothetical protein